MRWACFLGMVLCWCLLPPASPGFQASRRPPLPNLDKRSAGLPPNPDLPPERAGAAARLQERVPGVKIDVDHIIKSPKFIADPHGFLSGPNGQGNGISPQSAQAFAANDPHRAVKAFLNEHSQLFGHGAEVLNGARVKREFVTEHNGLKTTIWEQQLDGVKVFDSVLIGHVTSRGELINISSRFLPDVAKSAQAGVANRKVVQAAPPISARQAIVLAAKSIGPDLAEDQILAVDAAPEGEQKSQRFTAAPVLSGEIRIHLVWLPMDQSSMRLCWQLELTSRDRG